MPHYEFFWSDEIIELSTWRLTAYRPSRDHERAKGPAESPELRERWNQARRETDAELPELVELGRQIREASSEDTLSGHPSQ